MGSFKKEAARRDRQGKTSDGMANVKVKGENFYRSAKKAKQLSILNEGKAQRNADGRITKSASYQSRDKPSARIEPNRKWFNNSRVISQDALASFREAMAEKAKDPYTVLLKTNKLPMSLIHDAPNQKNGIRQHQAKIAVQSRPFEETFGPKAQRKRVKLGVGSIEDLAGETVKMHDNYLDRLEQAKLLSGTSGEAEQSGEKEADAPTMTSAREPIFSKGQSKRIWNELYKVIDSSDVVIHVLDARNPLGTRCKSVEKYIKDEAPHKHLIFVLNKCDLVPTGVAAAWVRALAKEYPTLAFHASINNSFGKGSLIALLRQFSALHSERKQVSVGFIGYPNTGKSSIINTLRKKRVCTVAPIPGETKVWQYITLMKRIYLIDCPGVVPPNSNDTEESILLKGVVRTENVEEPSQYIPGLLAKVKPRHIEKTYEIKGYNNYIEFLEQLGRKGGRLLKGGDVDIDGVAKMVINDFLRGKIPWFTPPPGSTTEAEKEGVEGRHGKLGEMGKKRKRPAEGDAVDAVGADDAAAETIDTASDGDSIEDLSVGSISDDVDSESDEEEDGGIPFEGFDAEDDDGKAGSD